MKTMVFFIALFALTACVSNKKNQETALLHLQIGMGHMRTGNYPQALSELMRAENLDPSNPNIQNTLGLAYYFRGRLDLAETHLSRALNINSSFSDARNNLSRVLIDLGKYDKAIIEATRVTKDLTYLYPEKPLINLGVAYFNLEKFKDAEKNLLAAIEISRDNCIAHSYYGRSLYERKEYRKAAEALDRAVGFCQKLQFDEPHYYGALSYFHLGEIKKSVSRLEEVTKIYTDGRYKEKASSMLETIQR
jgi:type IV pilus assembly protein PilF